GPLVAGLALIAAFGLVVLYSASGQSVATVVRTALRLLLGTVALVLLARVNPNFLRRATPWLYVAGCVLLLIVAAIGHVSMGAHRGRRDAGHRARGIARACDGGARRARRARGLVRLELHARLPEKARAHLPRPADRSARRRLPHHPVADRDRLGRRVRQGLDERQPGPAGVPSRALYRFHLRRGGRGVRAAGALAAAAALSLRRRPRALSRDADSGH